MLVTSAYQKISAQSDDLILEWEQHWETFGEGGTCIYGTHNFYVGDIDNDEVEELITGGFSYYMENDTRLSSEAPLRIWNWDGKNLNCENSQNWIGSIRAIYASDIDNDGLTEIITAGRTINSTGSYNTIRIWAYSEENIILKCSYDGISASSIYVLDVDNDQIPEILTAGRITKDNQSFAQLSILQYNENKLFLLKSVEWCASNEAYAYSVIAHDLDNDGEIEVITGGYDNDLINSSGQLRVWSWTGKDLILEANKEWRLVEDVYGVTISGLPMGNTLINNVKVGDIDSDSYPEIITGGWAYDGQRFNAQLKIWNWSGNALRLEKSQEWISEDITEIKSISLNDVDNDGDIEIVTSGITSVYGSFNNTESTPDHAQLRIWSWKDNALILEQSKDWTIGEGVVAWNLATGDIDKDGTIEIVTVGCMGEAGLCDPDLRIWSINTQQDSVPIIQLAVIVAVVIVCFVGIVIYWIVRKR